MEFEAGEVNRSVNHPWRRRAAIASCLLVVLGLPILWFWRQANARYPVVGTIDPATGYRAVYTVAQSWKKEPFDLLKQTKAIDVWQFRLSPPGPLQTWLNTHLFHRHLIHSSNASPGTLIVAGADRNDSVGLGWKTDAQGYTHIDFASNGHIQAQKHFLVSGHPATWTEISLQSNGSRGYVCVLVVKPRHQSIAYILFGMSDDTEQFPSFQREMRAMRDSFRLEQVAASTPKASIVDSKELAQ